MQLYVKGFGWNLGIRQLCWCASRNESYWLVSEFIGIHRNI
jgi:hypothetical protein